VNTLRAKIAVLLVVAIVSVVSMLTGVLLYLFRPPNSANRIDPVVEQVLMLARAVDGNPENLPLSLSPAGGKPMTATTSKLREALAARNSTLAVVVSLPDPSESPIASIPIGTKGWLQLPISNQPPPGGAWHILLGWLAVITFGATAIAVFVAHRMVQPLALLEKAIESVGTDAILPELPVEGPAEVRVAAKALNSLSSRLKTAVESRMRLVAAAGHDLRTPMTRMRLRAEFVTNDEDRTMWLKDLDELERIADSAILLVRQETVKVTSETFRLDSLMDELVHELRSLEFDVTIANTTPVAVHAGRLGLSRAFRNLLINAATHGARAQVQVVWKDNRARVIIQDEGPGIPTELIDQVFEPFFRVDPARRQNIPGAGLGLPIAHDLIERAGGRILIANGTERGLVQIVDLPAVIPFPAGTVVKSRATRATRDETQL